jgi:hypothetical protein
MDEEPHVARQLERIDALRRARAAPRSILLELRGLLRSGEGASGEAGPTSPDPGGRRQDGGTPPATGGEVAGGAG